MTINISTIEELQLIGNDVAYPLSGVYELVNDIDATNTETWNGGFGFIPIGSGEAPFIGTLNGNSYNLSGIFINSPNNYVGVFGQVSGCLISNLNIIDATVTGLAWYTTAIFAGSVIGGSIINNCITNGNVTGDNECAGFVYESFSSIISGCIVDLTGKTLTSNYSSVGFCSKNSGLISNCSVTLGSFVNDWNDNAGFCYINDGTIQNCTVSGDLTTTGDGAGFCYVNSNNILNCSYTGNMTSGQNGAMFVYTNQNDAIISGCYAEGTLLQAEGGAAFVFVNDGSTITKSYIDAEYTIGDDYSSSCMFCYDNDESSIIKNCYAIGTIDVLASPDWISSFVTSNKYGSTVQNCYSALSSCTGADKLYGFSLIWPGINSPHDFSSCYYDNGILSHEPGSGALPKSIPDMKLQATFVDWDFDSIWEIDPGITYPVFDATFTGLDIDSIIFRNKDITSILLNTRLSPNKNNSNDIIKLKLKILNNERLIYTELLYNVYSNYTGTWRLVTSGTTNKYGIGNINIPCSGIGNIDCCQFLVNATYNNTAYSSNVLRVNFR